MSKTRGICGALREAMAGTGLIIKAWNIFRADQKGSLAQLQAALTIKIEKIS